MKIFAVAALVLTGCASGLHLRAAPAVEEPTWHTMRAEHRVAVEFKNAKGVTEKKQLRGAIAVERPGRFRLAALGPGGIRLFDLLVVDGQVTVLYAFRAMEGSTFDAAVHSMAADLSAAYLLEPAPVGRARSHDDTSVTITEPGRAVRLDKFVSVGASHQAVPTLIEASAPSYHFRVDVVGVELEPVLDDKLFFP